MTPATNAGRTVAVVFAGLSQPSSTRLLADKLTAATVARLADEGFTTRVVTYELRDYAHSDLRGTP